MKCSNFLLKINLSRQTSLVLSQGTLAQIGYRPSNTRFINLKVMILGVFPLIYRKHLTKCGTMRNEISGNLLNLLCDFLSDRRQA